MPISFSCPHCGKQTIVADQYAGQSGPCAGCGQTIAIPGPISAAAVEPVYAPPAKGSGSGITILVVVGACLFVLLVCGGILVALLLPAIQSAREAARRTQCSNNLKQIALAFHNYNDTYGTFPPAYIPDANGQPMHSWRVLILPFLGRPDLHDQYKFDEPWNSPNNRAVTSQAMLVYSCPSSPTVSPGSTETNYMVITGPGTVFDAGKACKISDILDGTSNTLMVVEVKGTGVNWGEPKDLDASKVAYPLGSGGSNSPDSNHSGGLNAALCDGSVRFISESISPQAFNALMTKAGAELISDF
jgi:prepilin-type processing-associated H-X9-DG protein